MDALTEMGSGKVAFQSNRAFPYFQDSTMVELPYGKCVLTHISRFGGHNVWEVWS